jgi:soluble lytic murein transglycosylase-like protein
MWASFQEGASPMINLFSPALFPVYGVGAFVLIVALFTGRKDRRVLPAEGSPRSGGGGCFLILIVLVLAAFLVWPHVVSLASQAQSSVIHLLQPSSSASPKSSSATPTTANCPTQTPTSPPDYPAQARQDACEAGINPDTFARQINQESGFNPRALGPAGEQGIAQFMPSTAQGLGVDPWNAPEALKAAAHLMARYAQQYTGDVAKALAAYNAGSGTVAAAVTQGGTQWRQWVPLGTQRYIKIILQEA